MTGKQSRVSEAAYNAVVSRMLAAICERPPDLALFDELLAKQDAYIRAQPRYEAMMAALA